MPYLSSTGLSIHGHANLNRCNNLGHKHILFPFRFDLNTFLSLRAVPHGLLGFRTGETQQQDRLKLQKIPLWLLYLWFCIFFTTLVVQAKPKTLGSIAWMQLSHWVLLHAHVCTHSRYTCSHLPFSLFLSEFSLDVKIYINYKILKNYLIRFQRLESNYYW